MDALLLHLHTSHFPDVPPRLPLPASRRVGHEDRGEGVISAAIAVLIMAFLGVAVWVGFRATLDNTQEKVDNQVEEIGR